MKQSGLPASAVDGTTGSASLEKATHSLRKGKTVSFKLPKPAPAKRQSIDEHPVQEVKAVAKKKDAKEEVKVLKERMTIKQFVEHNLL
jgi:hypothetical protein